MYVGGTDARALHHLVYEVVDNAVDEALAGRASFIEVVLHDDGSVSVSDDGFGIPVGVHRETGVSTLELVMTKIGAGAKFDSKAYSVSGGLHGVGVSAVNALSRWVRAEVRRDGKLWVQDYEYGRPVTPVEHVRDLEPGEGTGTTIQLLPDDTIMQEVNFSFDTLVNRLREIAFVVSGVMITIRDERVVPFPAEMTFYFEGGLRSFIQYLNRNRRPLHSTVYAEREIWFNEDDEEKAYSVGVEVAFQYTDGSTTTEIAFANTIHTPDGGSHQTGMRSAITRTINNFARKAGFLKDRDANFSSNDTLEGLSAIVSIKHPEPQFESQTKVKLMNPEVQGAVSSVVGDIFAEFLEANTRDAKRIVDKCMISKRARDAASKARDLVRNSRGNLLENTTLPGKLADCSSSNPAEAELYIVEGDSAGGCFSGDTRLALVDGRHLSFVEIIAEQVTGKQHYCYTIQPDGTIGVGQIVHPRMTKKDAEVIRLTLDNDETITCTPDHRFMLRDGTYVPAAELSPDDSLMPLYRQFEGDTEIVWDPQRESWLHAHDLSEVEQLEAAAANHRITGIENLEERIDVYDIEVPGTHNFALASGVFVHNSAKQGRDRHFQAILPLRGKILNTERARLDKILDNNEVRALIAALGVGVGDDFDSTKLRYHRIIIMTDADVDGAHITTLLLTFFFRYMTQLIQNGHLYIAQPPLYLIQPKGKKSGLHYAYNEIQREQIVQELGGPDKITLQRYKGLGEMNPDQLWETTMNPENRNLLQVTIEDLAQADTTFDMLMGASVPPRKRFIQTHAKSVRNLDV
jgi:DNA gyrase subunit B